MAGESNSRFNIANLTLPARSPIPEKFSKIFKTPFGDPESWRYEIFQNFQNHLFRVPSPNHDSGSHLHCLGSHRTRKLAAKIVLILESRKVLLSVLYYRKRKPRTGVQGKIVTDSGINTMMHLKYPITRAQTDEERCHAIVAGRRQCHLKRCDGFKWCPVHGGARAIQSKGKRDLYKFRSEQYRGRFAALAGSDHIKNLRDEIAVLRMLLQHRIDYFEKDLLIDSYQITMLIRSIASLSESCAKIEHSLNDVMDKQSAADIVATMLNALPVVSDDLFEEITRLLSRFDHADEKPQAFNLNVTKWNIKDFFTTERIISIRSEIGVLRIILEQRLNECHDLQDLLMKSSEILSTVQDIEKLVVSCHRLEKTQGILLNDAESAQFANELIALIGKYVPADQLDKVANEFEAAYRESDSDSPTSQGDNQVL